MTPEELAAHWDAEADTCTGNAGCTRSLDRHVSELARAQQLRWCANQLRLVLGLPAVAP